MDVAKSSEEQQESLLHSPSAPYATDSDDYDSTDQNSEDLDRTSIDGEDLKSDLQKTIPECYKSDLSCSSTNCSELANDEDVQASALCQLMDIMNDLDKALDKSLMACLEGTTKVDSDEEDVVCKPKTDNECDTFVEDGHSSSMDDDTQVENAPTSMITEEAENVKPLPVLGRSKSLLNIVPIEHEIVVRSVTVPEELRSSMRRLDPIKLPDVTESLTLPPWLFVEQEANVEPPVISIEEAQQEVRPSESVSIAGGGLIGRAVSASSADTECATPRQWGTRTARSRRSISTNSTDSLNVVLQPPVRATTSNERTAETNDLTHICWPHRMSSVLASMSCTVGIFNISRFAIFSVHFGACFIAQFLMLSLMVGVPLYMLPLCLGKILKTGPVEMWKISPIFQGVGIALVMTQAIIGTYSIVGVTWLFVFFRDSFISAHERYKWAIPHDLNTDVIDITNMTFKIHETVPEYFNEEVLQRDMHSDSFIGPINFQLTFNLVIAWVIVFVALSKGATSYGKVVYVGIFLPVCGILILCTKLLTLIPYDSVINIFSDTDWDEFFMNSHSWAAAAQETFLTWGLYGVCVHQLSAYRGTRRSNPRIVRKHTLLVASFTLVVLLLGALLANTCVQILGQEYHYIPGSFETAKSSQFLWPRSEPLPGNAATTPVRYMSHYASIVGITVWRTGPMAQHYSGWQPLQLATQLVPATLAKIPTEELSAVWSVLFYTICITLGMAQQLACWVCVLTSVRDAAPSRLQGRAQAVACLVGLLTSLFMATDVGVRIVQFIDWVCAGGWWHCALHTALIIGVFAVRGRPYTGDVVAQMGVPTGRCFSLLVALLSFSWNIIVPVALCAICVIDFRTGNHRQLYSWRRVDGYWSIWSRQVGVAIQQSVLLTVPATACVQTWRYMSKGPPDILVRFQSLYRPQITRGESRAPPPDPPPKYTPPPSYSTATGGRLLHALRRSLRRLRRSRSIPSVPSPPPTPPPTTVSASLPPPPSYHLTDEIQPTPLRRSYVKPSHKNNVTSSLHRSFRYTDPLTTSHERLVRSAAPISHTVAMSDIVRSIEENESLEH